MKQLPTRFTYANVMSTLAVFLVLGGTAFAAVQLGKNTVGTKQLKRKAVTAAKIRKNAITKAKIKDGAVTGKKVKVSTLGTVPSAAIAGSANALAGQVSFSVRLGFGQQQAIATNGAVSLVANCRQEGGEDQAEVLFQTTANGAVANGNVDYSGANAAAFLEVGTPAPARLLALAEAPTGGTLVTADTDEGFVLGPEGKGLVSPSEGIILGVNYGAPGCVISGVVNAVG